MRARRRRHRRAGARAADRVPRGRDDLRRLPRRLPRRQPARDAGRPRRALRLRHHRTDGGAAAPRLPAHDADRRRERHPRASSRRSAISARCRRTPTSTRSMRVLKVDQPVKDPTTMTGEELVHEIQDLLKGLLKQGAKLPKNLMLYVKNMIFFDGATTRLAPDVNLFEQVTRDLRLLRAAPRGSHRARHRLRSAAAGARPRRLQAHARARGRDRVAHPARAGRATAAHPGAAGSGRRASRWLSSRPSSGTGRAPGHHSLRTPAGLHPVGGGSARDGSPARRRAERVLATPLPFWIWSAHRGDAARRGGWDTAKPLGPRAALDFVVDHDGPALFLLKDLHEAHPRPARDPPPAARPLRALPSTARSSSSLGVGGEVHSGRGRARPVLHRPRACPTCSS